MTDTIPVEFTVIGIEPVRDGGRLVGLAIVEVDVAGVVLRLQGIRITRLPGGGLEVGAPTWGHPRTGRWLPGVVLPAELAAAVAAEVLAVFGANAAG